MSRYFTEDWFYLAFNQPDCEILYNAEGIEVVVRADSTSEQREYLNTDLQSLKFNMCISSSDFSPVLIPLDVPEEQRDMFDAEDTQTAYRAFERLIRERFGMGIVSRWHQQLDRDIPGYRPLNERELSMVQRAISEGEYGKWMFRTAGEALRGLDAYLTGVAKDLDEMDVYDPVVLDWLNCAYGLKEKILRFGLPTVHEPNMFYGIEYSRAGFKVKFYCFRLSYVFSDAFFPGRKDTMGPVISGHSCTMLSSLMPSLSIGEYAERYGVSEDMVLEWITHGEIRTAEEHEQGWRILSGTVPPGGRFVPQTYIPTKQSIPKDAAALYPFLSGLSAGQWFQIRETEPDRYEVVLIPAGKPDTEGESIAVLHREERERFEYDLLRADWVRYDMRESMMRMDNLPE